MAYVCQRGRADEADPRPTNEREKRSTGHGDTRHLNHNPFEFDLGDDLVIMKISPRRQDSATWVRGMLAGNAFDALVFPTQAENEDYELGASVISNLFIRRKEDR